MLPSKRALQGPIRALSFFTRPLAGVGPVPERLLRLIRRYPSGHRTRAGLPVCRDSLNPADLRRLLLSSWERSISGRRMSSKAADSIPQLKHLQGCNTLSGVLTGSGRRVQVWAQDLPERLVPHKRNGGRRDGMGWRARACREVWSLRVGLEARLLDLRAVRWLLRPLAALRGPG